MSLGEDLMKMSLDDSAHVGNQPIRPPTLGEVKKSLRVCGKLHLGSLTHFHPLDTRQTVDSRDGSNG